MKAKAWKVTISGGYKTDGANKETVDYIGLEGIIPYVDEDIAKQNVIARYARMWIVNSPKYPKRPYSGRPVVYIDKMEEIEHDFSFLGKDIRQMDAFELQDLACAYDLRRVPLFQTTDLRTMQTVAYTDYNNMILGNFILDDKEEGYNIMDYEPIVVDGKNIGIRLHDVSMIDPADIGNSLDAQKPPKKGSISIDDLKKIADKHSIKYNPNVSYNVLYEKIYGQVA